MVYRMTPRRPPSEKALGPAELRIGGAGATNAKNVT